MVLIGIVTTATGSGQEKANKYNLSDLFANNKFDVYNRKISSFSENGIEGIRFSKNPNDGIAWLAGTKFAEGTIELDIRGKDAFQQSFVGVAFHGIDNDTLDVVYFRPFNFQSPDPARKIHAVQYISHPNFTWQVLRETQNGLYEKAASPAPNAVDWFHAKIVILSQQISVFINGNSEPSLTIDKLNDRKTGKIGLWVGNNSDGDFANLEITNRD